MKLEQYLTEKTYNINADVDLIYNKLYKPTHKYFLNKQYDKFSESVRNQGKVITAMDSNELKSRECKKADSINPVVIALLNDNKGNYYQPDVAVIHFSYNTQVINILQQNYFDLDATKIAVGAPQFKRFMNELSVSAIKGSIYHEISHWLNDTLHNRNIKKTIDKAGEHKGHEMEFLAQGHENVNFTFFEIDAQIHSLKQLKRDLKGDYDKIGWVDIIQYKPAFWGVFRKAAYSNEYNSYIKNMVKRMHREGLLTKKLQKVPTKREMMIIASQT